MAVNINTVYQRVLTIANKEQRGYITPQEFNILANQAQMDIFEQYFYDINQFGRSHGNDTEYSDMLNILEEKISFFEKDHTDMSAVSGATATLPTDVYRLGTVFYNNGTNSIRVEKVTNKEVELMVQSALYAPSASRPVYVNREDSKIQLYPSSGSPAYSTSTINCHYIAKPALAAWGYIITSGVSIYNSGTSTNFELHESEEVNLVNRILVLAGIMMKDFTLAQAIQREEANDIQQEKI
tara:strand:- start:10430 stop:11149 length:720 start_codon:yes stop_codon:yes gene_type:complete